MRIYLSRPVTGVNDYMYKFGDAEEYLEEKYTDAAVVNPARILSQLPKEWSYEECMDICLKLLDRCDTIYMLEGWRQSKGANREYGYALAKDMTIIKEDSWRERTQKDTQILQHPLQ